MIAVHVCKHACIHKYMLCVHACVCEIIFLNRIQTIWKCLYHKSASNHGTLGYFKSSLNRAAVKKRPKDDVNALLDFLTTVVNGHLVVAACRVLGISHPDSHVQLPRNIQSSSKDVQLEYICSISRHVVKELMYSSARSCFLTVLMNQPMEFITMPVCCVIMVHSLWSFVMHGLRAIATMSFDAGDFSYPTL